MTLGGCARQGPEDNGESGPVGEGEPPEVALAPDQPVGWLLWTAEDDAFAVGRAFGGSLLPNLLLARDRSFRYTAVLQLTTAREGRTLGFRVLQGQPAPGDELIAPGPELAAQIQQQLGNSSSQDGFTKSSPFATTP